MMQTDFECVDGAVACSTLTVEQACGCLRYAGVRMSLVTLRSGIEQGKLPFGIMIEGDSRIFIIFKHQLEEWVASVVGVSIDVDAVLEGVRNL
jgi:hypothetical protein